MAERPKTAKAVIIGGGAVGAASPYHPARLAHRRKRMPEFGRAIADGSASWNGSGNPSGSARSKWVQFQIKRHIGKLILLPQETDT